LNDLFRATLTPEKAAELEERRKKKAVEEEEENT